MSALEFEPGGYRFVKGVFQYSAGIAAIPKHLIVRVRFRQPVAHAEGFQRAEQTIGTAASPLTAPTPFREGGFTSFNKIYIGTLERWKISTAQPIRLHAATSARRSIRQPSPPFTPSPIRSVRLLSLCSSSPTAARRPRAAAITSFGWGASRLQACARKPVSCSVKWNAAWPRSAFAGRTRRRRKSTPFTTSMRFWQSVRRGAAHAGLTWHYNRPPLVDLEYEMDCRGVTVERIA